MVINRTIEERDELVLKHYVIVTSSVKRIVSTWGRKADPDDMYQVGMEALIKCASRWDESKASFRTYAYMRVYGAMFDELRRTYYTRSTHNKPIPKPFHYSMEEFTHPEAHMDNSHIDFYDNIYLMLQLYRGNREQAKKIIECRVEGLFDKEIGDKLGISEGRVCQILKNLKEVYFSMNN